VAKFFAPVHTSSGAFPAFYTIGSESLSGVYQPGRGDNHPPLSSTVVKERNDYLCTSSGSLWPVLG
jgi:hypothetical protein